MKKYLLFTIALLLTLSSCKKSNEPTPDDPATVAEMKVYLDLEREFVIQSLLDKQFTVATDPTFVRGSKNQTTKIKMTVNTATNRVTDVSYTRTEPFDSQEKAMDIAQKLSEEFANFYPASSYYHAEATFSDKSGSANATFNTHADFIGFFKEYKKEIVDCREYYDNKTLSNKYWYVIYNSPTSNSYSFKLTK